MDIRFPRMARSKGGGNPINSCPSKVTEPPSTLAGGWGKRPSIVWQVTDLPEPDSPTTPTISFLSMEKLTSSTARVVPARVWK